MNPFFVSDLVNFVFRIFIFLFISYSYIFLFKKFIDTNKVPSGYGIILPAYLFTFINTFSPKGYFYSALIIIFINTLIYFLDDIINLRPLIRILLQATTGLSLFYIFLEKFSGLFSFNIIILILILIVSFTLILANALNFYDGADLNLCLIILMSGLILLFSDNYFNENIKYLGSVLVSFSIGFGILNSRPEKIYLGDSGSFSIASILIFIFLINIFEFKYFPKEFLFLLALPLFDVFYVLLIRIFKKHNLLSRNYLHLYQRLKIKYGNFYYLIPIILNFFICLIAFNIFLQIYNNFLLSIMAICFIITPIVYLSIRSIYVEPKYFFGDGRE